MTLQTIEARRWGRMVGAIETIVTELVDDYVRTYGDRPMTWKTLHQIEQATLSRLDEVGPRDADLLEQVRCDVSLMCLPDDESPAEFDGRHFVPTVAAEIWRAYSLVRARKAV